MQIAALKRAGCREAHIFQDVGISGASPKRPQLDTRLTMLKAGDVPVVWKLDRLGRSLSHLVGVLTDLQAHNVAFRSMTENR